MSEFISYQSTHTLLKKHGQDKAGEVLDQFFRKVLKNLDIGTREIYPLHHVAKIPLTEEQKFALSGYEATHQLIIVAPDTKLDKFQLLPARTYAYDDQGETFTFDVRCRSEAYVPYSTQVQSIGGVLLPVSFLSLLVREQAFAAGGSLDLRLELNRYYCRVYGAQDTFDAFEQRVRTSSYSSEGWTVAVDPVSLRFFSEAIELMESLSKGVSTDVTTSSGTGRSRAANFEIFRVLRDGNTKRRRKR